MSGSLSVRMYNVGFGDSFLIRVRDDSGVWSMLVDCGSHPQGAAVPIRDVVARIIRDLKEGGADARLDVIVATHRHADHVSGFADDQWGAVDVGEVWLPWVEDPRNETARKLRQALTASAVGLHQALALRVGRDGQEVAVAADLARNSQPNSAAMDRLSGRGSSGFRRRHVTRYLPYAKSKANHFHPRSADESPFDAVTVHALGPSRNPEDLRRMDPPKSSQWLRFAADQLRETPPRPIFSSGFVRSASQIPAELRELMSLSDLSSRNDDAGLIDAAVRLDRVVNNTSVFLAVEVAGITLVLPGDAQQGAWEHVLADPDAADLLARCDVYKIGHHGSHNASPKAFVQDMWTADGGYALLPWGRVARWPKIPKPELLAEIAAKHTVVRIDHQSRAPGVAYRAKEWSEVTFAW